MTSAHRDLAPDEHLLVGGWTERDGEPTLDEVDRRILWLVSHRLTPVAVADRGWIQLYRDRRDGRLWELTFPQGSLHGGGPRRLECVAALVAAERYGVTLG